ncbi:hypothetical protein [Engelhardtia mirabilis]|uniref:Uncharacterized protein n=1 Tax=Engelhardtia mirabilis TaxID=2528011 RepID=A0A518BEQ6_9BACT|nr:hypothetical protein Pla133_05400 [Planctomycetes bacterium Pla133]QDU99801.1 hypothetical protein Pla86_05400 [Planctomycetes bacterium Pla86]
MLSNQLIAFLSILSPTQSPQVPTYFPTDQILPPQANSEDGRSIDVDGQRAAIGSRDINAPGLQGVAVPGRVHL